MNYLIGLSSNWNAQRQMALMLQSFEPLGMQLWVSRVRKTPAADNPALPNYLNSVVLLQGNPTYSDMHTWCKEQEKLLGRGQLGNSMECEADFDLLLSWSENEYPAIIENHIEPYYLPLVWEVIEKWRSYLVDPEKWPPVVSHHNCITH